MRKLLFFAAVIAALGFVKPAMAQDENRFSVYGGYDFVHTSVTINEGETDTAIFPAVAPSEETFNQTLNFNGGGGQFAYNINQDSKIKFGVLADLAGYHWSGSGGGSSNIFTYLFGPRISYGDAKLQPFVQALFGGARLSGSAEGFGGGSENAFAMTVGGGLDYQLTRHWFVRPVQAEYLLTEFSGFGSGHQNAFRYSAGVGYRWP